MIMSLVEILWVQTWQVAILAGIAWMLSRSLLKDRPHLCHLMWTVTLIKFLIPPFWASPTSFFSWCRVSIDATNETCLRDWSATLPLATSQGLGMNLILSLIVIWVLGVIVKGVVTWNQWRNLRSMMKAYSLPVPSEVASTFAELREKIGVGQVELAVTSQPIGPAVFGIISPVIVVPQCILTSKSSSGLAPILAHELLHVKRGDTLVAGLHAMVQVLWWFHPLAWFAIRESAFQAERCADDDVLRELSCKPRDYAACLIQVLEAKCRLHPIVGGVGMTSMQINTARLKLILGFTNLQRTQRRTQFERYAYLFLAILLLLATIPGSRLVVSPELLATHHHFLDSSAECMANP